MSRDLPCPDDVAAAASRIAPLAIRTPLLRFADLDARTGGRILLKAENLQTGGSFKIRGAMNRLAAMDDATRARGVVAFSSGNHAQGVARAAAHFGCPATIVMPADTPRVKIDATAAAGARIVPYDRVRESREAIAASIAEETGATLVPSFDDPFIVAGQGTVGLELAEQAAAVGCALDAVLVCASGGGLAAGIALALHAASPHTEIMTVEPEGFDDLARSLAGGTIERNAKAAGSIADALLAREPGAIPFAILRARGARGVSVSDAQLRSAVRYGATALRLVLEPGGAAALAAVLSGAVETRGRTLGVILSGGNIDPGVFAAILGEA